MNMFTNNHPLTVAVNIHHNTMQIKCNKTSESVEFATTKIDVPETNTVTVNLPLSPLFIYF